MAKNEDEDGPRGGPTKGNVTYLRAVEGDAQPIAIGRDVSPIAPKDPLVKLSTIPCLKSAKLDPDLRLPPRFEVRRNLSLWMEPSSSQPGAGHQEIMRAVLLPVRILRELHGEEQRVEVAYHARGEWHRAIVDRRACKDARRLVAGMPPDVAVTSNNSRRVVMWLDEYMRHNEERLPVARPVQHAVNAIGDRRVKST